MFKKSLASLLSIALFATGPIAASAQTMARVAVGGVNMMPMIINNLHSGVPTTPALNNILTISPSAITMSPALAPTALPAALTPAAKITAGAQVAGSSLFVIHSEKVADKAPALNALFDSASQKDMAAPQMPVGDTGLPTKARVGTLGLLSFIKVKPGAEKQFIEEVAKIVEPSRSEPGNVAWYVQQSKEDPTEFVFYTRWADKKALTDHLTSAPLIDYLARTKPLLEEEKGDKKPVRLVEFAPIDNIPSLEEKKLLFGAWTLRKFTIISKEGKKVPFCDGAKGSIMYQESGSMSVSINCADPAKFLFYAGKFRREGNSLMHSISNSNLQYLIGTDVVRSIEALTDRSLVLGGKFGGDGQTLRIEWER